MGNQVADLRLMQMFPWFGVLKNAKDEMSLMAKAKYESFRDAKLRLFYDVQRTWYELIKIQQEIRISEKNIEILKTIERLTLVGLNHLSTGGSSSGSSPAGTHTSGLQECMGMGCIDSMVQFSQGSSHVNAMGSAVGQVLQIYTGYRLKLLILKIILHH